MHLIGREHSTKNSPVPEHDDYEYEMMRRQARRNRHAFNDRRSFDSKNVLLGLFALSFTFNAALVAPQLGEYLGRITALPSANTPGPTTSAFLAPAATPIVADISNSFDRIAGLSASRSTITGIADSQSATAAYYWTMTLKNTGDANQEARMRISIPEGATVSRATLWVNGVAQEAAFGTRAAVEQAYTWVRNGRQPVISFNGDPLVITEESPGHLLVKAAPITAHGSETKLRIGFTAPLDLNGFGKANLTLPHVEESNFEISSLQDVHIESATDMTANDQYVHTQTDKAGFVLRANIRPEELGSLKIEIHREAGLAPFATRATHSPSGTYILARSVVDSNGKQHLVLTKMTSRPDCRIIQSEAAAHRLSTLWAYSQVEELAKQGRSYEANELAHIHRVVTSVSGATVLERDSDYRQNGLSRDMYDTSNFTGAQTQGGTPMLQGTTNSTIGPQGSDATVLSGVNTAGTVRVNNIANFEALMTILCSGTQIALGTAGLLFLLYSLFFRGTSMKIARKIELQPVKLVVIGLALVTAAGLCTSSAQWLLGALRDANLLA